MSGSVRHRYATTQKQNRLEWRDCRIPDSRLSLINRVMVSHRDRLSSATMETKSWAVGGLSSSIAASVMTSLFMVNRLRTRTVSVGGLQPRFGIFSLMLVTLVFCGMATAGRYLMLSIASETSNKAVFVIFTLAAPMFMVVAINITRLLLRLVSRRR